MKKIVRLFIIIAVVTSCGGGKKQSVSSIIESNDLAAIRAKREEIVTQQTEINNIITLLDEAISKLDTVRKIPNVSTIIVNEKIFNHYLELHGNIETNQNIVVVPEFSGVLTKVFVQEGQQVTKGQTLAKIDDGGLSQQLSQVQIQAELSKTTFERQQRLWNQKIGSELQYLQAKTQYDAQRKTISQIQEQIAKTVVKAPFSGIVDDIITKEGSVVAPGQPQLFRIVNLDQMYVKVDVPERYVGDVTVNKDVKVGIPVLGTEMDSKVKQTSKFINPANRTFKIEIPVQNKNNMIKPNLTAKLKINDYTNAKALLIPQNVISENAEGQQYVYVVSKKKNNEVAAKQVVITTGKSQNDLVEVLSGITNGAEVILEGARSVKDGQQIQILNQ